MVRQFTQLEIDEIEQLKTEIEAVKANLLVLAQDLSQLELDKRYLLQIRTKYDRHIPELDSKARADELAERTDFFTVFQKFAPLNQLIDFFAEVGSERYNHVLYEHIQKGVTNKKGEQQTKALEIDQKNLRIREIQDAAVFD